ncbi:MAG: alpha/beta hydrolase [Anaerolineales bacterium]
MINKEAAPFYFHGNKTACLLVHGFTSSPREMRPLGEFLAAQGYTVLGVRLFAHATRYQDMPRARWEDWLANIEDGWYFLNGVNRPVVVIGFSLGGALSLYLSTLYPVKAVVAIAAPFNLPRDLRAPLLKPLSVIYPYIPIRGQGVWFNLQEKAHHIRYPNDSTRALAEVRDFLLQLQKNISRVTAPTLLIYSQNDPTVRIQDQHMESIYSKISSPVKEKVLIENSGHIIPLDKERDFVFQKVVNFIARVVI